MKTLEDVVKFLKDAKVYYLATVDGDQPHVRPFGTAHIYNGKLYIQTGKKKDVAKQIYANGKAEICAFQNGQWLRICGTLLPDDSVEAKKSMLDAYTDLRAMYDENDDNTIVFYFDHAVATLASFTAEPETVQL